MMPTVMLMTMRTITPTINQHARRFLCDCLLDNNSYTRTSFTFSGGWLLSYALLLSSCVVFLSPLFLIDSSSFSLEVMSVTVTLRQDS